MPGLIFSPTFSPKKLLNFYFLGVIIGALVYMLSYNLFPAFQATGKSYLLGASAGVMAVLVGIATHIPNMRIRLLILGPIKFWYIAAFLVVIDVIQIPFGKCREAIWRILAEHFLDMFTQVNWQKGNDIGSGFEKVITWFLSLFVSAKKSRPTMHTVYKKTETTAKKNRFPPRSAKMRSNKK
ncbi:MAG: rhomboid family intramembrane serine protease [Marinobacter sp.]|nr:rhomboid family intramembrane serine protease [Marinobacter sp.]